MQQAEANKISADANVLQMKAKLLLARRTGTGRRSLVHPMLWRRAPMTSTMPITRSPRPTWQRPRLLWSKRKQRWRRPRPTSQHAQINLGYCTIKSPVKGVIIDRRVNIGQTVVSSLSAPSLFLIAKDLKRIQVWVSVNEADIGSISPGQPVTFTVDAFPNQVFQGRVGKIRLNATMTQNVVTYTVEVNTNNDDGKLLPYLTANAQFIDRPPGRRAAVVPNAALRWSPRPNQIAPEVRQAGHASHAGSRRRDSSGGSDGAGTAQTHGTLWVEQGNFVRPVHVNVGLTDGTVTEVEGSDLTEGLRVVVGEATRETADRSERGTQSVHAPNGRATAPRHRASPDSPGVPGSGR